MAAGLAAVVLSLSIAPAAPSALAADSSLPTPTVTVAPIGVHQFPFASTTLNLGAYGYVEEEFDFSGTAQAYVNVKNLGSNGRWNVAANPGAVAPYTLRMLVRRPSDPGRFNGTVVVEWLNDTAGFDNAWDWQYLSDDLMKSGYAYVGVTAQYDGAAALQAWEAGQPGDRYASIIHPGDSFSYDIYSQAGRAIAHPRADGAQPLGALTPRVKALLSAGYSRSAYTLTTYVNAIHRVAHVYDGFLVHSGGHGYPLSVDTGDFAGNVPTPPGVPATPFIGVPWAGYIRTDQTVPVLFVASEFDEMYYGAGPGVHQEADSSGFRLWEIAGMSHFDPLIQGLGDIQKSLPGTPDAFDGCAVPPPNSGQPGKLAVRAALHALDRWVQSGVAPASAPRLIVDAPHPFAVAIIHRDPATNIALGGIRLPPVDVPIGTLTGDRPKGGWLTCFPQTGAYDPWDHDTDRWDGHPRLDPSPSPTPEPVLQSLYPTHTDYVRFVAESAWQSVAAGFLRPGDGLDLVEEAIEAQVP